MGYIWEGITSAIKLIITLDSEVFGIVLLSLRVSGIAIVLAALVGVPVGALIGMREFWAKRLVVTLFNTLLALPTVVVGLIVYSLVSRQGPFGFLELLYTPTAMVIGQFILATPIVIALTISACQSVDKRVRLTVWSLGATGFQSAVAILEEARFALLAAIIAAFGRVITEVGSAMILGGNIKGYTRIMTTAIALETSRGEFELGIALGIVLLIVALSVNILLNYFQSRGG